MANQAGKAPLDGNAAARPRFPGSERFQAELRRRVDAYFQSSGRRPRDCWQMYLKTAIILSVFGSTYYMLVFVAATWWQAVPLAVLLGLVAAGIGLNIQHDGGHHAYSDHPWINRTMAMTMDLIGASSYFWRGKHVVFHHTYTNIVGHDTDVEIGLLGRFTPHQRRLGFHRWQHYYLWLLYGFLAIEWHLYRDPRDMIRGRVGQHPYPRPRGWNLVVFILGKLAFFGLAFGLPLLHHSIWKVVVCYGIVGYVLGLVLAVVFQLAHVVEQATFPLPDPETGVMEDAWAVHQLETTVDFSRKSRVLSWLLGGLNYQIEHHLFPRICHIHYNGLSAVVEGTCAEFGVPYRSHPSFGVGIAAHFRLLRALSESRPSVLSSGPNPRPGTPVRLP